jgi:imidazolonepropionase-like amidohydrolase
MTPNGSDWRTKRSPHCSTGRPRAVRRVRPRYPRQRGNPQQGPRAWIYALAVIVLRAARLIDGRRQVGHLAEVHVDGSRIAYVGPSREAPPAGQAQIVDLGQRTLLPGLIDCHAHPVSWDGPPSSWQDELRVLHATDSLRRALLSGVTTLRNTGSPRTTAYALKAAVDAGVLPGPRLLVAGPVVCSTGGHGYMGGGEADGPDAVRREVRDRFKHGAQFIKLTATGGGTVGTVRHRATYTVEELAAAAQEAAQHDSYATAHVHGTEGIVRCLDAGVQMLEHATFVLADNREHFDADVAARIRDHDVAIVPTVQVYGRWVETSPGTLDGLSDADMAEWQARYTNLRCQLDPFPRLEELPQAVLRTWRHRFDSFHRRVELVGELYRAGVVLLMGSDGGGRPGPIDDLGHGIQLHVQAGVPALEAIASATSLAAQWLRIDEVTGSLEIGKQADVIAVDGDPLADIGAMSRVDFVMRGGTIYKDSATCT